MKIVLDENVSAGLAPAMKALGFSVLMVGSEIPSGSDDNAVFEIVLKEKAALITRDYHFTNPVRFNSEKTRGIIYIHQGNLTSNEEIRLVSDFFKKHSPSEFNGRLVTIYPKSIRIR